MAYLPRGCSVGLRGGGGAGKGAGATNDAGTAHLDARYYWNTHARGGNNGHFVPVCAAPASATSTTTPPPAGRYYLGANGGRCPAGQAVPQAECLAAVREAVDATVGF